MNVAQKDGCDGGDPSFSPSVKYIPGQGIRPTTIDQKFVVKTPFKNKVTKKTTYVPILNFDGHLEVAHLMGLISLTADILDEWKTVIPAGLDEHNNPKYEEIWWIRVKATAVVKGIDGPVTATGYNTSNDRDPFIKKSEYLLAVAETRAMKRALACACGITEAMYNPDRTGATREAPDLPIVHIGDEDEPDGIPQEVRRTPNITPPLTTRTPIHPNTPGAPDTGGDFGIDF